MIAHRIERTSGKDAYGRLACYVLDLSGPRDQAAFDRLASYIVDREGDGERVVGARITNCEAGDDIALAIREIEQTQAENTRTRLDKSYHLVISFPEGERPTADQLRDIEDHLVAAIGYADHQRISAVHDDTDNLHIHVAINKIHPTNFKAIEPHFDKRKLMTACRELELRHGLKIDNHGLAEDRDRDRGQDAGEDRRQGPEPGTGADKMEAHGGRESLATWIEANAKTQLIEAASQALSWADFHERLADLGLTLKPRGAGFVIGSADGKAHVKASSVDRGLGVGPLTERLGNYQPPSRERGRDEGAPSKRYDAGPRQDRRKAAPLYERFQRERARVESARDMAVADLGQAHAAYSSQLSRHYRQQRKVVRTTPYVAPQVRKRELEEINLAHTKARAERRQLAIQQRAFIRQSNPLPTWQSFLEREAARGDEQAVAILRSRVISRSPEGANILTAQDRESARHVVYQQLQPVAAKNGDMIYQLADGGRVTDRATEVRADRSTTAAAFLALSLAADRYGHQPLELDGSDAFKAAVISVAAIRGFDVTFADPDLERARLAAVAHARGDEVPETARSGAIAYVQARNSLRARVSDVPEHRVWSPLDAGPAEYAGRRRFADGSEAVLLQYGDAIAVLPVTSRQAAKASTWAVGDLVITDDRGRFLNTGREHGARAGLETADLAAAMKAAAERSTGNERGGG